MKFSDLPIKPHLKEGLQKQKLSTPTEVQEKSIPMLLEGKDLIARAKTGSGKTIAFLLPILNALEDGLQALILTPTRELALQIHKDLRKLDKKVEAVTIYGGVGIQPQIQKLRTAQIVVGTPGRMLDHIGRKTIDLSSVKWFVLDEADRMLDMGFIVDVENILAHIPKKRQTMLFSATVPKEVLQLSKKHMRSPERLMLQQDEITVKKIRQVCYGLDRREKLPSLLRLLRKDDTKRVIVFCNTKSWAERLGSILGRRGFRARSIHSGLSQNKRTHVIEDFKLGKYPVLVATDVAARGLHIPNVSHVINYDMPKNPKDYIHRIGRTGRAGLSGDAVSFITQMDEPQLRNIEREIAMQLNVQTLKGSVMPRPQVANPEDTTSAWHAFD